MLRFVAVSWCTEDDLDDLQYAQVLQRLAARRFVADSHSRSAN